MRAANLPPARAGPSLRRGIGPFFAPRQVSRYAARRSAPAPPPCLAPPTRPRVRLGAFAPSPDARQTFPPPAFSPPSARGLAVLRTARRRRASRAATGNSLGSPSSGYRIRRRHQPIAWSPVPQFLDPFRSSPVLISDRVWPGIVRSFGQRVGAPARSFGPVAGLYSAGRGFAPSGSTKPAARSSPFG